MRLCARERARGEGSAFYFLLQRSATSAVAPASERIWQSAATGTIITEDFEDETVGPLSLPATFLGSNYAADVPVGDLSAYLETGNMGYAFPVSGQQSLGLQNLTTRDYTAQILLPAASAFGFDITGFQDFASQGGFGFEIRSGSTLVDSGFFPLTSYAPDFRGFTSTLPFDNVRMTFENLDYVGFDDISANPVASPADDTVLALGAALAARRRRPRAI